MTRAVPDLDVARRRPPTVTAAAPGAAAPELVGLHRDVDAARATLSAAWPKPTPSSVPDVLAPGLRCVFCGINPGRVSAAAAAHFANPRNDFWRLLHDAGFTPRLFDPHEQFDLLELGYGVTNAPYRTTPGSGDLRRGDFDAARGSSSDRARARPRAVAFVGKEALPRALQRAARARPAGRAIGATGALRPALDLARERSRALRRSGCAGSRRCARGSSRSPREAVRALVVDADERVLLVRFGRSRDATWWGTPGRRHRARARATSEALRRELLEEIGLRGFELGPVAVGARERVPVGGGALPPARTRFHLVRVAAHDAARDDRPRRRRASRTSAGGRSTSSRRPASACAPLRRCSDARAYAARVTAVLVDACICSPPAIWFGGSTALVFVGVPAIRTLEGEPRGRAMKELGLRWRPLGYGALLVAALTGVELAAPRLAARSVVPDRALGEGGALRVRCSSSRTCTTSSSARACRRRSRAGGAQPTRPRLVVSAGRATR